MEERPLMIFRKCFSQRIEQQNSQDQGIPFAAMSAGQLQIIRKLALVILTGHMERYCPTHRSGWNWELPKFIKKIKMPDYKDKKVFGVPLILIMQRTGQTLPIAVRAAFRWLQLNALDQIGLFRKSGVKSRIAKLKEMIEYSDTTAVCMDVFDTQQAYDVADMLKQYFRDLPESLLTTKMSETFAAIFMRELQILFGHFFEEFIYLPPFYLQTYPPKCVWTPYNAPCCYCPMKIVKFFLLYSNSLHSLPTTRNIIK